MPACFSTLSRLSHFKLITRAGEIAFHMAGTHRRIYVRDVLAYKMQHDGKRRRIIDDLTRAEAEDGLYKLG